MGFCVFGNVAIAARYAQRAHGLKRVFIIDFDVHHGNGTNDAFYDDPDIFFLSTHQVTHFPIPAYWYDNILGLINLVFIIFYLIFHVQIMTFIQSDEKYSETSYANRSIHVQSSA